MMMNSCSNNARKQAPFRSAALAASIAVLAMSAGSVTAQGTTQGTTDSRQPLQNQSAMEQQREQAQASEGSGTTAETANTPSDRVTQQDPIAGSKSAGDQQFDRETAAAAVEPAQVTVESAAPEVTVQRGQPVVTVKQFPPEITVHQPAPQITVIMPDPEVSVDQKQPEVRVVTAEPRVRVQQAGEAATDANVKVEGGDEQQAEVKFIAAQQPKIKVEQAEPKVTVRRASDAPNPGEMDPTQATDPAQNLADAQRGQDVQAQQRAAQPGTQSMPQSLALGDRELTEHKGSEIVGQTLRSTDNQPAGQIRDLVVDMQSSEVYAVVDLSITAGGQAAGVVVPVDELTLENGQLTTDKTVTELSAARPYTQSDYRAIQLDRQISEFARMEEETE